METLRGQHEADSPDVFFVLMRKTVDDYSIAQTNTIVCTIILHFLYEVLLKHSHERLDKNVKRKPSIPQLCGYCFY